MLRGFAPLTVFSDNLTAIAPAAQPTIALTLIHFCDLSHALNDRQQCPECEIRYTGVRVLHEWVAQQAHCDGRAATRLCRAMLETPPSKKTAVIFGLALLHTFSVKRFEQMVARTRLRNAESRKCTEPPFDFVMMVIAASRQVMHAVADHGPAAMTIAALVLAPQVFQSHVSEHAKYVTFGALFVNVSIGGTLTACAAPPVLTVANTWGCIWHFWPRW